MTFRALHVPGAPFVIPNPWDAGSARMLQSLGFQALASTSAGAAFARGQTDGSLSIDQMLEAAAELMRATDLPVNADLEHGGGDTPEHAAHAITRAASLRLAGASIEDLGTDGSILSFAQSLARIEAAVEAAKTSDLMLTARSEIMLSAKPDFDETLRRITAFARAGADVVFAPGLKDATQISAVVTAAEGTPVNVLIGNNTTGLTQHDLAKLGVARISTGSGLARAAYGAVIAMAETLQSDGTITYPDTTASFAKIETLLK